MNTMNTDIVTQYGNFRNMDSLMHFMKDENLNKVKGQCNYWGAIIPFNYSYNEVCQIVKENKELK